MNLDSYVKRHNLTLQDVFSYTMICFFLSQLAMFLVLISTPHLGRHDFLLSIIIFMTFFFLSMSRYDFTKGEKGKVLFKDSNGIWHKRQSQPKQNSGMQD